MNICWLDTPDCSDPVRVGGKAAQLGRLALSHPVPPGFCLTAVKNDPRGLPPDLYYDLMAAYFHLGERCGAPYPRVAVRSSAVDEDGQAASFAGQYETYLNIAGPGEVAAAVRHCMNSARAERARHYREAHQLAGETEVAVLIQQLIVADVSAVVFSADPRTGDRDHVLINATWGLGESLVGGTVTPDLYRVRKRDLVIVSREIACKQVMTIARADGTQEVAVPHTLREEPALQDAQIRELAALACSLETTQQWAVDLECAYQGRQLYLLQCRPITTLKTAA